MLRRLIGPRGTIPVLIRDDDTNFFTKPQMLESIYSKAWEGGFKVCLSTVPINRGINDISVPPSFRKTHLYYSIADNESLLRYLKYKIHNQGSVEILQHGFSHDYSEEPNRWELGSDSREASRVRDEIRRGKIVITQAFDYMPKFFVPPGEDLTLRNLKIILESDMVPIYRQTLFDRVMRSSFIPDLAKRFAFKQITNVYCRSSMETEASWALFMKPVTLSLRNNAITWSNPNLKSRLPTFRSLFDLTEHVLQSAVINRTPICILNHYHIYYDDWNASITKNELFSAWSRVLDYFNINDAWKVTFSEFHERVKKINNIDIIKTGSKITLKSKDDVQDFSFIISRPLESNGDVIRDEQTDITTIRHISPNKIIVLYEKT